MTPDLLNIEQYNRLGELYRRLAPNAENQSLQPISDDQENEESPDLNTISQSDTPGRRGPGRPSKKPKLEHEPKMGDSWYRLRDLTEIHLDVSLRKLIAENPGHEATDFLDSCTLTFPPLVEQGIPTIEALARLSIPLRGRLPTSVIDNVRWLFQALVLGDMVMFLHGSEKPYRLTSAMKQSVRDAASEFYTEETTFIDDVLVIACNIVFMCTNFGTGSLFWLRSNFTKDL